MDKKSIKVTIGKLCLYIAFFILLLFSWIATPEWYLRVILYTFSILLSAGLYLLVSIEE
jgi:hypothetical protein